MVISVQLLSISCCQQSCGRVLSWAWMAIPDFSPACRLVKMAIGTVLDVVLQDERMMRIIRIRTVAVFDLSLCRRFLGDQDHV